MPRQRLTAVPAKVTTHALRGTEVARPMEKSWQKILSYESGLIDGQQYQKPALATNDVVVRRIGEFRRKGGQEMGLDQKVVLAAGHSSSWPAVRLLLASRGCVLQIR